MAKINKIVKTRKMHKCSCCEKDIPKGSEAIFSSWKGARYDDYENQIGIEFHRYYYCFNAINSIIEDEEHGTILIPECA